MEATLRELVAVCRVARARAFGVSSCVSVWPQMEDSDIVTIEFGQNTWFIHCNTVNPASIVDRAVVVSKDFDDFTAQIDAKLAQVRWWGGPARLFFAPYV